MKATRFEDVRDLLVVKARVWGRNGRMQVALALDTGSAETVIVPEVVDRLGYSPREGVAITRVRSAVSEEQGYTLRVRQFETLGFAITNFPVHVFDLAEGFGIDGLVGLSFLNQFNYEVRSRERLIRVERIVD